MPVVAGHRSSASGEELPTRRLMPGRARVVVEATSADSLLNELRDLGVGADRFHKNDAVGIEIHAVRAG